MEFQSRLERGNSSGQSAWGLKIGGCRVGSTGWCLGGVQQNGGGYFFAKVSGWKDGVPKYEWTLLPYNKGDFVDHIIESFAGPHDYLNAKHYYFPNGNGGVGGSEFWNIADVGIALPFAFSGAVSHYFPGGDVFIAGR